MPVRAEQGPVRGRPSAPTQGMRIGYVLKKYPRLSETFILNEILGLEDAGLDVSVFSLRLPDEGRFHSDVARVRADVSYPVATGSVATLEGFAIVRDFGRPATGALNRALAFLERLPQSRRATLLLQSLQLARDVRERSIDHLHAHFMTIAAHAAYLTHLFTGVPFTVTAHAKDIYRMGVDSALFTEVAAAARAVVTVCDSNRRFIETELLERPASVVRIYNGLALEELRGPSLERSDNLILGVGRLVEKKGFDVLLQACEQLRMRHVEFECVIVGDGDQRAALEQQRLELGLGDLVHFTGALPRDKVVRLMRQARVLSSPCVTGNDGNRDALPTVLIEALALGLPVVSTPVGGIQEIVSDGLDGLIVDERDVRTMSTSIEMLLTDDDLWAEMSERGRSKAVRRFDRSLTLPLLIALFEGDDSPNSRELAEVVA